MSKPRTPGTIEAAIRKIIGALELPACAKAVGKSESLVYKWGDQDNDASPSFKQALALDTAYVKQEGKPAPLLSVYAKSIQDIVVQHDAQDPKDRLMDVTSELGDVARSIAEATSKDSEGGRGWSPNEIASCCKELDELLERASQLRDDLTSIARPTAVNE